MSQMTDMKFLIVDDFSTMRRIVRGLLKEIGYNNAEEAEDGAVALGMLKNQKFDFVVSDINMPNMNGFQLLGEIKKDEKLKHLPVLMVTAEARKEDVSEGSSKVNAGASIAVVPLTIPLLTGPARLRPSGRSFSGTTCSRPPRLRSLRTTLAMFSLPSSSAKDRIASGFKVASFWLISMLNTACATWGKPASMASSGNIQTRMSNQSEFIAMLSSVVHVLSGPAGQHGDRGAGAHALPTTKARKTSRSPS